MQERAVNRRVFVISAGIQTGNRTKQRRANTTMLKTTSTQLVNGFICTSYVTVIDIKWKQCTFFLFTPTGTKNSRIRGQLIRYGKGIDNKQMEGCSSYLRSHEDNCDQGMEGEVKCANREVNYYKGKCRESRRISFEDWLTDKEQESLRLLQSLQLEKMKALEDETKKKEQRNGGKTYEAWLVEKKKMMVATKDNFVDDKEDETIKQERQEIARRRYDKWLMDKETKALAKELEMLRQEKLKTIEMRKKYEERKRKLRNLKI